MTRFELATPATRTRCATKLRYIPIILFNFQRLQLVSGATSPLHLETILNRFSRSPCYIPKFYSIFNGCSLLAALPAPSISKRYLIVSRGVLATSRNFIQFSIHHTEKFIFIGCATSFTKIIHWIVFVRQSATFR